ncbi:hypothetical protein Tco_1152292 [Tanacetum coccineum]
MYNPKWREKVTTIEESKHLSSLALDELIGNLKVHEVVMEKDFEIYRGKNERHKNCKRFFRRKGKFVRQPREENKSFRQRDERKGKSDQKCFRCGDPNHLIGDYPKPSRNKDQKAFIGGSLSDNENDAEYKTNDETCLMAHPSNENKTLKAKRDLLEKEVLELNEKIKKLERSKEIDIACKLCQELKLENARLKETQANSQAVNKSPTHYPCDSARTFRVILFSIHNDEWKSFQCHHQTALRSYALSWKPCQGDSLNLPDHRIHKDGDGDASFQLKSDSLPHAHAQTTKTFYKHQDSRIMKAQELKTKTSAQTLIYKIFLQRYQVYQGRLLASFQDDAKYEHVGQDTRSQGGKDDQDGRIKI